MTASTTTRDGTTMTNAADTFRLGLDPADMPEDFASCCGTEEAHTTARGRNGMTHEEFEEGMLAVHEGRATDLTACYFCGDLLRGVLRTRTSRHSHPEGERHEILTLSCGHEVI